MTKILVLRNKPVFKGLFIHSIGCEHDQDLGPAFSYVFKLVGHLSTYLEKTPNVYQNGPSNGMAVILKVSGPGPRSRHCLYVYM